MHDSIRVRVYTILLVTLIALRLAWYLEFVSIPR